ncbi:MAG: UDP binding domain-containing protein [Alphaproteobacteria bacterium]
MRYESAELTKISINFCLIGSLSAANVLAELCEAIGADWSEIVPALHLDGRIGPAAYLKPGLGLSGGNLERDMATVEALAREHGTDTRLVSAWGEGSRIRKDWAYRILRQEVLSRKPNASIGVLGLAYKENTHSTKNSPALALLAHRDLRHVRVFDPVVSAAIVPHAIQAANALDALQGADAVAVMTPWPAFRVIAPSDIARAMAGRILLDPYALFDSADIAAAGLDRFVLGRPPERATKGA